MKFDDFDRQMRVYEESLDQFIPPDMYIAARLDGRSFTRLTKKLCKFEAPFDVRFRDMMIGTVKALMTDSGFRIIYGYENTCGIYAVYAEVPPRAEYLLSEPGESMRPILKAMEAWGTEYEQNDK